ncbi:MAG: phosphodiester glycosidase family protein [Myxococcaceae bacterium]
MRPALLAALLLSGIASAAEPPHKPFEWSELQPGLQFARLEATKYVTRGSPYVAVLRIDPAKFTLQPHHFKDEGLSGPLPIDEWQTRLKLPVFNAGQYAPDLGYMGTLKREGKLLPSHESSQWLAALVTGPKAKSSPAGAVLDLHEAGPATALPYKNVIQSFMLRDDKGQLRTRRSAWEANRTVVAQQRSGHLLVVVTEGAFTLAGLSDFLGEAPELDVLRAMSMDGGYEAELAVPAKSYVTFGQWETNDSGDISLPGTHFPLPAVIAIVPKG